MGAFFLIGLKSLFVKVGLLPKDESPDESNRPGLKQTFSFVARDSAAGDQLSLRLRLHVSLAGDNAADDMEEDVRRRARAAADGCRLSRHASLSESEWMLFKSQSMLRCCCLESESDSSESNAWNERLTSGESRFAESCSTNVDRPVSKSIK